MRRPWPQVAWRTTARTELKGYNSRERILEVALQEFSAWGLIRLQVDDIAEQAGASKRMIYYHFGGSEDPVPHRARVRLCGAFARASCQRQCRGDGAAGRADHGHSALSFDHHQKKTPRPSCTLAMERKHPPDAEHIAAIPHIAPANRKIIDLLSAHS